MKRFLLVLSIFCSVFSLSLGQNIMHALADMGWYMNSGEYQQQQNEKKSIVGSPYLTEDFKPGMLKLEKTWYEDVDLRYDIYSDCFEVMLETEILVIDPMKNDIDSIRYNGEVFVRKISVSGKKSEVSYMSHIGYVNSYYVYKQHMIKVSSAKAPAAYSDAKPAEFKPDSPDYYIFKENEKWQLTGNKSIAEIFDTDQKEVKKFLRENKYKLSNENDLIQVIRHYSTL